MTIGEKLFRCVVRATLLTTEFGWKDLDPHTQQLYELAATDFLDRINELHALTGETK